MKHLILLLLLTCSNFMLVAQKCKFEKGDPFSDKKEIKTDIYVTRWAQHSQLRISAIVENGKTKIGVSYSYPKVLQSKIIKNDVLKLNLENGTQIALAATKHYTPTHRETYNQIRSDFSPEYDISIEEMKLLNNFNISHIKIMVSDHSEVLAIKSKKSEEFKKAVSCILREI